jgi:hypothetical protein
MWYNIEEIKKIINFWNKVTESFKNADVKLKKNIVKTIGSDHFLYQRKMTIILLPWYKHIQESNNGYKSESEVFGPLKNSINTGSIDATHSNILIWQPSEANCGTLWLARYMLHNSQKVIEVKEKLKVISI